MKTVILKLGSSEVYLVPYIDSGCLKIVDHLGFMFEGKSSDSFHLYTNRILSTCTSCYFSFSIWTMMVC